MWSKISLISFCLWVSSAGAVTLAWDASARAQGYTLSYRQEGVSSVQVLDIGPATSAVVSGLTGGSRYFFAARAYNTAGLSPYSNEVTVVAQATPTPPVKPYSMAEGKLIWKWEVPEPDPDVTGYLFECGRTPGTHTITSKPYPITTPWVLMTDVVGRTSGTWYCQQIMLAGSERRGLSNEFPFALAAGTILSGVDR